MEDKFNAHDALSKHLDAFGSSLAEIAILIDAQLTDDRKNYDVTFDGADFHFHPATTIEDKLDQSRQRKEFISILLKICINEAIDDLDKEEFTFNPWDRIHALFAGPDPDDFKMRKSDIDAAVEEISKEDEIYGRSRPLNLEAYQVKMQDRRYWDRPISWDDPDHFTPWDDYLDKKKATPPDEWNEEEERKILLIALKERDAKYAITD